MGIPQVLVAIVTKEINYSDLQFALPFQNGGYSTKKRKCSSRQQILFFKVYGYTLEEVTLSFTYLLPFSRVVNSQKKEFFSSWSKFFPLRVNPSLEGLCQQGKQTISNESCSP